MSSSVIAGILFVALAAGVLCLVAVMDVRAAGMNWLRRLIRRRFPKVNQLSTAGLATQLNRPGALAPLILDVRRLDEYAVSHLPTARHVDPKAAAGELARTLPTDRPVVLYCSVGYRSSQLATRLIEAGSTNVSNLEGSIFQWANEGRPLECDGQPTDVVHPYSAGWSWLVRRQARAPLRRSA